MRLKLFRLAAVATVLLSAGIAHAADWSVVQFRDPQTAEDVQAARAVNAAGFSVTIFRNTDKRVRWILALPQGSFDRLKEQGRVASFRVDKEDSSDVKVSGSPIAEATVGETWVRDILWHGGDPSPLRGNLRDLLDGQELTVRFYAEDGQFDAAFPLHDAPEAIAKAINIVATADPKEVARVEARDAAIMRSTMSCMSASDPRACAGVLAKCMGPDANALKAEDLKSCMTSAGYRVQ